MVYLRYVIISPSNGFKFKGSCKTDEYTDDIRQAYFFDSPGMAEDYSKGEDYLLPVKVTFTGGVLSHVCLPYVRDLESIKNAISST